MFSVTCTGLNSLAVVDKESLTDELRTDRAGACPRLDRLGGSRLNIFLNLLHQLEVDVGSFFSDLPIVISSSDDARCSCCWPCPCDASFHPWRDVLWLNMGDVHPLFFTTTHGVGDGVLGRTTNLGATTEPALAARLAQLDQAVILIADDTTVARHWELT